MNHTLQHVDPEADGRLYVDGWPYPLIAPQGVDVETYEGQSVVTVRVVDTATGVLVAERFLTSP